MVSMRFMTAPITTATWAALVMLRPAVAVTNCARPGNITGLVIGQHALRKRETVGLAKVCTKARLPEAIPSEGLARARARREFPPTVNPSGACGKFSLNGPNGGQTSRFHPISGTFADSL